MKASSILFAGMLLATSISAATAATYQFCSTASDGTSSCRNGGGALVFTNYAKTKYPVVLAHGMGGFTAIGGVSLGEYFYGINWDLTTNGANVFATQVTSFDSSYVRGEQLRSQVNQILAITGAPKVNLIGHSQGVLDSRYVAGVMPNNVASVTGVAGPNTGSPVADFIKGASTIPVLGPALKPVITGTIDAFFKLLDLSSGGTYTNSSWNGLNQLTTEGMAAFNAQFPQAMPTTACGQGVAQVTTPDGSGKINYYSWGGTGLVTNLLNPADYFLSLTGALIPGPSDGLVPQCSSHLGAVLRDDYYQNHLDEVNLFFGLVSPFEVSPVTLFRNQANRLKTAGL
ncbi:MAG: lipase LipC [Aquirhabdus sp.]